MQSVVFIFISLCIMTAIYVLWFQGSRTTSASASKNIMAAHDDMCDLFGDCDEVKTVWGETHYSPEPAFMMSSPFHVPMQSEDRGDQPSNLAPVKAQPPSSEGV